MSKPLWHTRVARAAGVSPKTADRFFFRFWNDMLKPRQLQSRTSLQIVKALRENPSLLDERIGSPELTTKLRALL